MKVKKFFNIKIVIISLVSILTIILATIFTIAKLAFNNDQVKEVLMAPNRDYVKKIICSNVSNTPTELSLAELNKIINDISEKELYVTSIKPNSNYPISAYIPILLHGMYTTLNFSASIKLVENNLEIELANTKIGKLPIPTSNVLNTIEKLSPNNTKKSEKKIIVPAILPLSLNENNFNIEIVELNLFNNCVNFKTKEILQNIISIINDNIYYHF